MRRSPCARPSPANPKARANLVRLLLVVSFGTGLSSFMYEIGWIRLLSMIIGSATHSFEVMLSAFVFGLAVGGLWVRGKMDRFRNPEIVLGFVQILMGVAAVATLPLYGIAVQAMGWLMAGEVRTENTWLAFNALRYGLCLVIMFPATFCAGMTLPLITHLLLKRGQSEAIIGRVYGFNTFGAIAGATLAGLLLMPLIGLQRVIVVGAIVDILLGLTLLRGELQSERAPRGIRRTYNLAMGSSAIAIVYGLAVFHLDPMVLSATVYRHGRTRLGAGYELISYVDGRTASVAVIRLTDDREYRVIYTNGKPDASLVLNRYPKGRDPEQGPDIAGDEPNQILVGLIPMMIRPDATHAALIGFGSGVTAHVLLASPTLERLDTIEIEPEMVAGSRNFLPVNERAYSDPRNHFWFDDAKAYFAGAARQYDFIVSEPTNPWVSGVSSLFTVEFYREVKRYLKPSGVLAQWLQGYELSNELLLTVLAALDQEFSDYQILRVGDSDWVILAVADGELGTLSPAPLQWPALADELRLIGVHDIGQMDGLLVANRRMLHPFLADKPANSDAHPRLDTGAEKARFMQDAAGFLHSLRWTPVPLLAVLGGLERRPYPPAGIGDLRKPHVFLETEQAAALMRLFEDSTTGVAEQLSVTAMNIWIDEQRKVEAGFPDWDAWVQQTYGIFTEVAPHVDLTTTKWWATVCRTVLEHDELVSPTPSSSPPARPRRPQGPRRQRRMRSVAAARRPDHPPQIDTLDALHRRDGPRLQRGLDDLKARGSTLLSDGMRSIAGMIALELQHADADHPPQIRRTNHMDAVTADDDPSAENLAYRALRAYAERCRSAAARAQRPWQRRSYPRVSGTLPASAASNRPQPPRQRLDHPLELRLIIPRARGQQHEPRDDVAAAERQHHPQDRRRRPRRHLAAGLEALDRRQHHRHDAPREVLLQQRAQLRAQRQLLHEDAEDRQLAADQLEAVAEHRPQKVGEARVVRRDQPLKFIEGQRRHHVLEEGLQDLVQEQLLGLEVAKDRPLRHLGAAGDLARRGALEAALRDQLDRRAQNALLALDRRFRLFRGCHGPVS
jgi:spermidine synthase